MPGSVAALVHVHGITFFIEDLGEVAILVVPHLLTVGGIYTCIAHHIVAAVRLAYLKDCTGVVDHVRVLAVEEFGDLVLVVSEVDACGPQPILVLEQCGVECGLEALVGHVTHVGYTFGITCGCRPGHTQKHVAGLLCIEVEFYVQTVEDTDVDTQVPTLHGFPCQSVVGSLAYAEQGVAVIASCTADQTLPVVVTYAGVTGCTVAQTDLCVGKPLHVLEELFVFGVPCNT